MIGIQPHFGPGDPDAIAAAAMLVTAMRATEPLIVGTGVATAEEIGQETFEQRLMDEGQRRSWAHCVMADSHEQAGLLGFWAKTDLKSTPSGPLDPDLLPDFPALGEHLHGPGLLVTVFIGPETVDPCRRHAGGCHARLGTRPRQNQAPAQAD